MKTRGDFRQLSESSRQDGEVSVDPNHPLWELWDRMTEFYGAAFLSQYGETPNLTWVEMLKDLTPEQYAVGFNSLKNRDSSFPPNPGEFRSLCEVDSSWERQCHRVVDQSSMIEDQTAKERRAEEGLANIKKLREEVGL